VSTAAQLIGTRLGAYDIQAVLGSGGMANVYRAFDTNLQRMVAIKVLSPAAAAQPGFVERFRQEARLIANLRHPNIVHVYDFDQHENTIYMVQELLAGPTLERWMCDLAARGTRPTPQSVIEIVTQLASALDAAHAAGIIHRDVKPGNALWNDQGHLVLTDFGIAKQVVSTASQTQVGLILGTPSYLSPEQAQGLPLTPASDIYSLGIVLYELLAGNVPFRGTTPMHVLMDHIQTPPPPLPPLPDLPHGVELVMQRVLAKDPAARFGSASELARALADVWADIPASAPARADIHNQATRVWQPPTPAPPGTSIPVRSRVPPVSNPVAISRARPAAPQAVSQAPLAAKRSGLLLPILGALLAVLLLGGMVLAARGGARAADTVEREPTSVPALAQGTTNAPIATRMPAQPSTPSSDTPGVPSDPFAELQAMLEAGRANGELGQHGDELLGALRSARQALATSDTKAAVQQFTLMQQILLAGSHGGTIKAGIMIESMKRIQALAKIHGLTLPLTVQFD
jgi:eukaryotic-like serine/threonine-protein kinase